MRPDLLREHGIDPSRFESTYTWEDLELVMREFADTDTAGYAYWGGQWNFIIKNFKELIYQQGANIVQPDGRVVFNSNEGKVALNKMVEWREKGWVPEAVTNYGLGDLNDLLINGKLAMVSSMSSQVSRAINAGLDPENEYMIVGQPVASEGPNPRPFGVGHLNNISINRFAPTAQKLAAALYMDCRWSYESQWFEYVVESNGSYMNKVYDDATDAGVAFSDVQRESANNISNDFFPQARSILLECGNQLKLAVAGSVTPEEALDSVQEYTDTILGQ
jgi:ABC-type glycerol-3-phosphate transport system substrate-binding protein